MSHASAAQHASANPFPPKLLFKLPHARREIIRVKRAVRVRSNDDDGAVFAVGGELNQDVFPRARCELDDWNLFEDGILGEFTRVLLDVLGGRRLADEGERGGVERFAGVLTKPRDGVVRHG